MDITFFISLMNSMLRMSMPLIFATTGEIVAERAGVINIGMEGQMLLGAFSALCITYATGSPLLGVLAAALIAAASTLPLTELGVKRKQDQSVVGIMFNIMMAGLTSFLYRVFYGVSLTPPSVQTLPVLPIPLLSKIPILGSTLFSQTVMGYVAILITMATWYALSKTVLGMKLGAVGENPRAAQAAGISVILTRRLSMLYAGFLGGLGGAFLTIAYAGRFTDSISAGRGYIALSIVIFGRWNPLLAMAGSLLFGVVDAFQLRAQTMDLNIPYQFFVMLPYVVVLISILFVGRKTRAPKALGVAFEREGR